MRPRGVAALIAALVSAGCAGSAPAPTPERPAWVDAAKDAGRVEGGAYVHDGLALRVAPPEGWVFLQRDEIEEARSQGSGDLAEQDKDLAAEAAASDQIATVLFLMVDTSSLQGAKPVPTLLATLEPVDPRLVAPAAIDYALGFEQRLERSAVPLRFERAPEAAELGGAPAARVSASVDAEGAVLHQSYWFCVRGRLLLSLVASYADPAQGPRVDEALARVVFAAP